MQDGFNDLNVETLKSEHLQKSTDVRVLQVPISKIVPNPYQPRKKFEKDALLELAKSIRQYGVLQPLLVAPGEGGTYILIAGERRLRASAIAGLKTVPVIVSEYTTRQKAEIALIENLQRKDLHYLEEAEGYEKLIGTFHLTRESLAVRIGKKQSTIANKLRLLKLSSSVRKMLRSSGVSERHASLLLKLEKENLQKTVLQKVLKRNLNFRQTEALVAKTLKEAGMPDQKKPRFVIANDVRCYLNSIREIMDTANASGIPAGMEQELNGDDVVVTLRIKNIKKRKDPKVIKLF